MGGRGSSTGGLVTNESSNFGRPGTYELYRTGDLTAPNGMIFLSADALESTGYQHDRVSLEQYQLNIKNPLVVSEDTDRNNVIAAWKALHPGEDPKIKTSGLSAKKWQQMDQQNAKALEKSDYDAIIYKKADGKHEVQIPKSSANRLTKKNSYKLEKGMYVNKDGLVVSLAPKSEWVTYKDSKGYTVTDSSRHWKFNKKKGFMLVSTPKDRH